MILSRSLKSSTDDGPTSSESDCLDPAVTVTECTTDETTDESTEVVDGNNATLEKGVIDHWSTRFGIRMTEFHGGVVVVNCTVNTTHHTLIISKEEDGETSNAIDGDEKATLLIFMDHIIPRNDVHGGDYPECLEVTVVSLPNLKDWCPAWLWRCRVRKGRSKDRWRRAACHKNVAGMGVGSYIQESTHLSNVSPGIPHLG